MNKESIKDLNNHTIFALFSTYFAFESYKKSVYKRKTPN